MAQNVTELVSHLHSNIDEIHNCVSRLSDTQAHDVEMEQLERGRERDIEGIRKRYEEVVRDAESKRLSEEEALREERRKEEEELAEARKREEEEIAERRRGEDEERRRKMEAENSERERVKKVCWLTTLFWGEG